jgi:hypothetical protein
MAQGMAPGIQIPAQAELGRASLPQDRVDRAMCIGLPSLLLNRGIFMKQMPCCFPGAQ